MHHTAGPPAAAACRRAAVATFLALALALLAAPAADAWFYSDIVNFNLTETTTTYGQYSIGTTGDGAAYYEWLDDPSHTTVISGNSCGDLSLYGKAEIPAHDTSYYRLFWGTPYLCFALRGRVAYGAGSMYYHDGRLRR